MPPRSSLTSSFSITDAANNEVVCPLRNQDGSSCRKRCIGVSSFQGGFRHVAIQSTLPKRLRMCLLEGIYVRLTQRDF